LARIYKTIRLAFETKYWIDQLIEKRTELLQASIRDDKLQERIEAQLFELNNKDLDGISINISLNVTVGSVIEQAVRYSRNLSEGDWRRLAMETEAAKKSIKSTTRNDSTPRIYLSEEIYRELEDLQIVLKRVLGTERLVRISFAIKLAVYNLYKSL
jgi:hypothetical protein